VANGVVYVGLYDGSGSSVYALNASTGSTLWSYTTGAPVYSSPTILGFIENNFNLGIGKINPQYQFADAHAPDAAGGNIPLADFFPLTTTRPFQSITVPLAWQSYDANYFLNYNGQILDPDNDAIDND
jgi:hypothetical protein